MTVAPSSLRPPVLTTGPALVASQRGGGRRAVEREGEPVSREAISAWIARHGHDLDRATTGWPRTQRDLFAGLAAIAALDPVHSAQARGLKDALFRSVEDLRRPRPIHPELGAQEESLRDAMTASTRRARDFLRFLGVLPPARS